MVSGVPNLLLEGRGYCRHDGPYNFECHSRCGMPKTEALDIEVLV